MTRSRLNNLASMLVTDYADRKYTRQTEKLAVEFYNTKDVLMLHTDITREELKKLSIEEMFYISRLI